MTFDFDVNKTVGSVRNFWNNIHFHPTDAIEDDWGKRILDRVAADGVAKTVRMYAMLEDIVKEENGKLVYDFTLNDIRLEYMISKGFDILLSYNFIPPCIASDPEEVNVNAKNATRYKGKFIVTSYPKDYGLWEEICRVYTEHIVEKFGLERVKSWHLQCYNEPDIGWFFMKNSNSTAERTEQYLKLYKSFEKGVLSVSKELCIGGPALATELDFFGDFLDFVKNSGTRLDYISVHTYGTGYFLMASGEKPLNVNNTIDELRAICKVVKEKGFADTPIIVDEWGAASQGFCNIEECPLLIFRDTEVYSAYFGRMISAYEKAELAPEKMMICLSGQHEMKKDFTGFRNFFTLNFFPKAIYNAYVLAGKLLGEKLYQSEYITENYAVYPTVDENKNAAILFTHANDTLTEISSEETSVTLNGDYEVRLWTIDKDSSNAYGEFMKLGSPDELTSAQIEAIRKNAEAKPVYIGKFASGEKISFNQSANSVVLLEAKPCR